MTTKMKNLVISIVCLLLPVLPAGLSAQDLQEDNSQEVINLLREQNEKLSNEIRRIHREIAALRADLDKPDVKDVFGGIGYILGLCGVGALVAARRKNN
jgi:nickel transport protein